MAAVLADRARVSEEQYAAANFSRNFFLRACPGSGKTRTIGLRLAWASVDGAGRAIAAVSYTNAAVAEMQKAAAEAGVPIAQPHWVGTVHSFFNTYVLAPFAPLALGSDRRLRVVANDFQRPPTKAVFYDSEKPPVSPWDFQYCADGSLAYKPAGFARLPGAVIEQLQEPIKRAKARLARGGFVSQNDALYFAMRLLEDRPELAAAVAARFDEFIVDEFQDTSPMQLRCVELLCLSGELSSLVLCGDLDQAIYEFTGADPTVCEAFVAARKLETLTLTENYRSSQAICDVMPCFSRQAEPDLALGAHHAFGAIPELLRYDPSRPADVLATFTTRLGVLGLAPSGAVVLTRRHEFKDRLNGTEALKTPGAMELVGRACARVRRGGTLTTSTVRALDSLLASIAFEDPATALEDPETGAAVRQATMALLDAAPELGIPLPEWISAMQSAAKMALAPFGPLHKRVGDRLRRFSGCERYTAADVFAGARDDVLEATIIHGVKGESHDAVLLVAEPATSKRDNARRWIDAAAGGAVTEEVRVAYVGLTRARRYCAVGLPEDCHDDVTRQFLRAGFRSVDDPTADPAGQPYRPPARRSVAQDVAAVTPEVVTDAFRRWANRSPVEQQTWSQHVCALAGASGPAVVEDWSAASTSGLTVADSAGRGQLVWCSAALCVQAAVLVLNESGAVTERLRCESQPLALKLWASVRRLDGGGVALVVHAVARAGADTERPTIEGVF